MKINDREYRIIIPKWDNSGRKIATEEIEKIAKKMTEHFGGVTVFPSVLGCWKDEERDRIVCEENAIFSSFRDTETTPNWEEQKRKDEEFVRGLAKELGVRFGQGAVLISEDKVEVDFIKGKYRETLPKKFIGIDWFRKKL